MLLPLLLGFFHDQTFDLNAQRLIIHFTPG